MKKHEIKVGGHYVAKVAGKLTTVRVDAIREAVGYHNDSVTRYDVTNLTTGRKTTFRSAAKFRNEVTLTGRAVKTELESDLRKKDPVQIADTLTTGEVVELTSHELAADRAKQVEATQPDNFTLDEEGNEVEGDDSVDPTPVSAPTARATTSEPTPTSAATLAPTTTSGLVDRLAQQVVSAAAFKPKFPLTDEQQAIIDTAPNEQVLVIEAGAGTGKTSTLEVLARSLNRRGQYTAFNTKLVDDSKGRFPSTCPCNTIHSLAFRSEGYKFKHRMRQNRVRSSEVAAMMGVTPITGTGADGTPKYLQPGFLVAQVSKAVKRFCQSADPEIGLEHFDHVITGLTRESSAAVKMQLLPHAVAMWNDVSTPNGRLPFQHDHYVKVWQLNRPIISTDYVLLDEAQDTSPVMLDVLAQQVARGTQVFLVGDSAQQIYSWRGAVNALAAFPDAKRLLLSQSFRFGQVVAEVANAVLSHLTDKSPLVMKGFEKINSRLDRIDEPSAILCRTNAAAVSAVLDGIARNKRPHLVGGGDEVLAFVNAALTLQRGNRTEHPELACFERWSEVQAFIKTDEGEDLKLMVKLIDSFTAAKIKAALEDMPAEKDADFVVSTAHRSKGREWHHVKLASDFMPLSKMGDEELRLLYVAATRAKTTLDVTTCAPFCGGEKKASEGRNGEGGQEEVIDISEARRLSEQLPKPEAVTNESVPAEVTTPTPTAETKRSPMDNTWSKSKEGDWLVRGRPGQTGKITVYRRDRSSSMVTVRKVVWEDNEVALYEVSR